MTFTTKPLSPELWEDFQAYFTYQGNPSGCWCMNHRLPIGCDFEGEAARLAIKQLIEKGRVYGLLAYTEGDPIPVGWCALDRRKTLPGHDCIEEDINCHKDIWAIHCLTSRKDYKGKGVEEALSQAAVELGRTLSAQSIEVYPEPGSQVGQPYQTWNTFHGHQSTFESLGFKKIDKDYGSHEEFYNPLKLEL